MTKFKSILLVLMTVTITAFTQSIPAVKHLSAADFKKKLESGKYLLIDVRTPVEFAEGHLKGAINIDVNADDFVKMVSNKTKKNKSIALYCRSGRRSKVAIEALSQFKLQIVELNNGIASWQQASYQLVK